MSTTVDNRVVEMRFDNKQFEANIATSMSTLDKLKQKLNLTGAAKGFENIDSAARNVNMSGLGAAVDTVRTKFSALQIIGITALANITNSAINAGKRMVSALTIDPIKTGFQEYETQIGAIQTILANTQKEGTNVERVNAALDELNLYADKTIYNFAEMTRNIGTFTAAGVKLDASVNSIKGIANLAAISGSTSQQASTAMYQLSQAMAAGTVKLMDWNSVVYAGMGGQVFQDALVRTSEHLKTGAKNAIEAKGSFRESLQTGWLTAEVLTQTLDQFATAAETQEEYEAAVKKFVDQGYTQEEAKQMADMARTAGEAATKVKTFSQLWDTLKEAAQSGWGQSWRIIVGDFEEAKNLFTELSDTLGGLIGKSADARNKVLQEWKDLGGRTAIVDAFRNAFEGIGSIIKPISEAFREIFPPITAKQLVSFSEGLRDLTTKLKLSDDTAAKLKSTFKGVFSVFDIGIEAAKALGKGVISLFKSFTGLDSGILGSTASIGNFLSNLRNSIVETNFFGTVVDRAVGFLSNAIVKIKEFGSSLKEGFNTPSFEGILDFFKGLWSIITQVGSAIGKTLGSIGNLISDMISKGDIFEVLNGGLFAGVLLALRGWIKGLTKPFSEVSSVFDNVKGILDDVRDSLETFQNNLKAGTLLKIASAIGILAASLFVLSTIDPDALSRSLVGLTVLFGELLGSLTIFTKITTDMKGVARSCAAMISMSIAIAILSGALKKMSSLDWNGIAKGLVGVGVLMTELSIFLNSAEFGGKSIRTAIGIVILSSAMLILASAVKKFGSIEWNEIGKGLISIGALLAELSLFSNITGNSKHLISTGISMVLLGASMKIFASAIKDFSNMNLETIGKGLLVMAGALTEVTIAMGLMPKSTILIGAGLVVVAEALKILANGLTDFGGMSWDEIGKGLLILGGSLAELTIALNLMKGTVSGSAALLIAAGAISLMVPSIKSLGELSLKQIVTSLMGLAGAFAVIGAAGLLLSPLIPTILGLAGAFALLGVASLGIGVGLSLIATGLTALAAAGTAGATAIVASLTIIVVGIADLIPTVAQKLGEGIIEFARVIGDYAPQLAESFLKLILEVLKSLETYAPQIVDSLLVLFIGIFNSLADHMPELIQAAMNFVGKLFQGIVDALNGIDTGNLLKGILAVGLMTALMYALSGVVALIPSAMAGALGVGIVIAELALVLAAIGGLAQIPGLQWLIEEGGNFLQKIGTAIGQFVGGITGGFASGISSSFPKIGSDLSAFITNLKPFIDGAKNIDASAMDGVKALGETILILTAADILSGMTSWLAGGSSISDFATQLVPFGEAMKEYSDSIVGIDADAITSSATAAKALSELANNLPNTGGVISWFAGENDISIFAEQLVPFGKAMKQYSDAVAGINADSVTSSATAAKALSELANNLPNSGGLVSWLAGENNIAMFGTQLIPFGKSIKAYADSVAGLDTGVVENSVNAAKALSELANNLPNTGGLITLFSGDNSLSAFGLQLIMFGRCMKTYANSVTGIDAEAVMASSNAAKVLGELANNLPNTGGLASLFTGESSIATFGAQLVPFGRSMKQYAEAVTGINAESVTASANAAASLAKLSDSIPNFGGLASLFTGDNSLITFAMQLAPFGRSMKAYSDSVVGIDASAVEASANAAKALASLASNLPNIGGLASLFAGDKNLSSFGSQLVPFGKSMKQYANAVAGIDAGAISNSATAAKSLVKIANSLSSTGGLSSLFSGNKSLSNFGNQLVPFGKAMKSYSNAVSGIDTGAISNSATAIKKMVSAVNSTAGANTSGVNSFKNAINTLGKVNVNNFVKAFTGSSSKLTSAGGNMINAVIKGIKSKQSSLISTANSIVVTMTKAFSNKMNVFKSAGVKLMTQLVSGINTMKPKVSSAVVSSLSSTTARLRTYYRSFYNAGSYVASGFAAGIRSRISSAAAAAAAMANAATTAAKANLKINSPSKVFKNIGAGIPEGFIMGIGMYGNIVKKSTMDMTNLAVNGANKAIDMVSSILDSDIDIQPTIRPVVDLDDVENSVGVIDRLFGNNPYIGATADVGRISSMMNRYGQNGNNDDIIYAINKLSKKLDNVGGNSYSIGNVTYDDGSNITELVKAIITQARIERRS